MSTQINNQNAFRDFLIRKFGGNELSNKQANRLDIDKDDFAEVDENDNNSIEIDEILDNENSDLYAQFATMYVAEQDKKTENKDAEKEKEEQNKVKDKNGAKGA